MDKRNEGYVAGIICVFGFVIFLILAVNNEWNFSGQILWSLTIIIGGLSVGCFWKPETFGAVVSQFLQNISKSGEGKKSNSDNKQIQRKSSGVQVMTGDQSAVNVYSVSPEKKENTEKSSEEIMLKETRIVNTKKRHVHKLGDLAEGDQLIGEASSTRPIDIELISLTSYRRLRDGEPYKCSNDYRHILTTNINFTVPMDGTWYLLIRNKGKNYAKVSLCLRHISAQS